MRSAVYSFPKCKGEDTLRWALKYIENGDE